MPWRVGSRWCFLYAQNCLVKKLKTYLLWTSFGETPLLTRHHATPLVTLFFGTASATDFRNFYSQVFFILHFFLLVLRPPRGWQFNLKASRVSCWSSKHSPCPTIHLNHNNPQKGYSGRFYLRVMAGRLA